MYQVSIIWVVATAAGVSVKAEILSPLSENDDSLLINFDFINTVDEVSSILLGCRRNLSPARVNLNKPGNVPEKITIL